MEGRPRVRALVLGWSRRHWVYGRTLGIGQGAQGSRGREDSVGGRLRLRVLLRLAWSGMGVHLFAAKHGALGENSLRIVCRPAWRHSCLVVLVGAVMRATTSWSPLPLSPVVVLRRLRNSALCRLWLAPRGAW
jgi:hypothetical protein